MELDHAPIQVDHAIFTSLRTSRLDGYQLIGATPGVTAAESRELSQWGPAHDSLAESATALGSVNFHPLSSGRYCVSRTVACEAEYSGRGGARIETRFYLASPEDFARFSNNPFRVLEAVAAVVGWPPSAADADSPPPQGGKPGPVKFSGRAAPVDRTLLAELLRDPGPSALCELLDAVLQQGAVGVAWRGSLTRAFAGVINLLPVGCRGEVTFSTGLRFSSRRPFRLIGLPADPAARKRIERGASLYAVNWNEPSTNSLKLGGWAAVVRESLLSGRLADLGRLIDPRFSRQAMVELSDLAEHGEQFAGQSV